MHAHILHAYDSNSNAPTSDYLYAIKLSSSEFQLTFCSNLIMVLQSESHLFNDSLIFSFPFSLLFFYKVVETSNCELADDRSCKQFLFQFFCLLPHPMRSGKTDVIFMRLIFNRKNKNSGRVHTFESIQKMVKIRTQNRIDFFFRSHVSLHELKLNVRTNNETTVRIYRAVNLEPINLFSELREPAASVAFRIKSHMVQQNHDCT